MEPTEATGTLRILRIYLVLQEKKYLLFLKKYSVAKIIVANKKVVRYGKEGYERIYAYNGQYVILTAISTNGFVVTAYPKRKENA